MSHDDDHEHWQLPRNDSIKVNSDAAIFEHNNYYGHAFVARNHHEQLIETKSRCLPGKVSPELGEVWEVLSWIKDTKCCSVEVEVEVEIDYLQVVQAIQSSITSLSYLGRVIKDFRTLLVKLKAQNVLIRFVKRSVNKVSPI